MESLGSFQRDPNNPGALFPVYSPQDIAEHTFRRHVAVLLLALCDRLPPSEFVMLADKEVMSYIYLQQVAGVVPAERKS